MNQLRIGYNQKWIWVYYTYIYICAFLYLYLMLHEIVPEIWIFPVLHEIVTVIAVGLVLQMAKYLSDWPWQRSTSTSSIFPLQEMMIEWSVTVDGCEIAI